LNPDSTHRICQRWVKVANEQDPRFKSNSITPDADRNPLRKARDRNSHEKIGASSDPSIDGESHEVKNTGTGSGHAVRSLQKNRYPKHAICFTTVPSLFWAQFKNI